MSRFFVAFLKYPGSTLKKTPVNRPQFMSRASLMLQSAGLVEKTISTLAAAMGTSLR